MLKLIRKFVVKIKRYTQAIFAIMTKCLPSLHKRVNT